MLRNLRVDNIDGGSTQGVVGRREPEAAPGARSIASDPLIVRSARPDWNSASQVAPMMAPKIGSILM